jgi:hypothetical protein
MGRYTTILIMALAVSICFCMISSAQDNQAPQAPAPDEVSIYGEVTAANAAAGSITVQYYDYDADEEKSLEITTGTETKLDNAATVADIKAGNWVDVTYISKDAKNLAKSIFVEKDELQAEMGGAAMED